MMNLVGAEWTRLMRRGMLLGSGAVVALGILTTLVVFGQASTAEGDTATPGVVPVSILEASDGLVQVMGFGSQVVGAASLVLFARTVTNDYQHGTLKVYLTREPRRLPFLTAKVLAMAMFLLATLLVTLAGILATASAVAGVRGIDPEAWWTAEGIAKTGLGFLRLSGAALVWGCFGLALGTILRSAGPAIGVGIGAFAIGGHLAERFWGNASEWFPSLVLSVFTVGGSDTVSLAWASAMTATYAAVLAVVSGFAFTRGDVPG